MVGKLEFDILAVEPSGHTNRSAVVWMDRDNSRFICGLLRNKVLFMYQLGT
jgi:hypothetical protein